MNDLNELRATLIQLAKALETERACVIRIQKIIERQLEEKTAVIIPVNIQGVPNDRNNI